jgi:hypothetical protein
MQVFGAVMATCIAIVCIGVFITMINSLRKKELLWPKDDL